MMIYKISSDQSLNSESSSKIATP